MLYLIQQKVKHRNGKYVIILRRPHTLIYVLCRSEIVVVSDGYEIEGGE